MKECPFRTWLAGMLSAGGRRNGTCYPWRFLADACCLAAHWHSFLRSKPSGADTEVRPPATRLVGPFARLSLDGCPAGGLADPCRLAARRIGFLRMSTQRSGHGGPPPPPPGWWVHSHGCLWVGVQRGAWPIPFLRGPLDRGSADPGPAGTDTDLSGHCQIDPRV
jgi:hypothetical protein